MTQAAAPSLDELQTSLKPAWLWDVSRCRVVWANLAGVRFFDGETLFDLLDRPFDAAEPGVGRIVALAAELKAGEAVSEKLAFPSSAQPGAIACTCTRHALGDGRAGLLVVADEQPATDVPAHLMTGVLSAMPIAIVVTGKAGETVYVNAAAQELIPEERRGDLTRLTGSAGNAGMILERVAAARTFSTVLDVMTVHGERELKVTARRLDDPGDQRDDLILIMLDDVTDRRSLERALSAGSAAPLPEISVAVPAESESESAFTPDDARTFEKLSQAIDTPAAADEPVRQEIADEPAADEIVPVPEVVSGMLDNLEQAIILHNEGKLCFANRAAGELLGYEKAEELTQRQDIAEALNDTGSEPSEIEIADAQGAKRNYRVRSGVFPWHHGAMRQSTLLPAAPGRDGAVAEAVPAADKAAAVQSQPRPVAAERHNTPGDSELRAILDTATDGIITLDTGGRILSFSAGAEAMFGYRLADVADKPLADFLEADSQKILKDYLAALSDSGIASVFDGGREVSAVSSQGGQIPMFLTISRLGSADKPPGTLKAAFCAVVRDITQWKQTEQELRAAKTRAEQSSAQKSEFLAQISHELRTPLNAILGFSDVMRTERFGEIANDKYLGYANDIHESGSHLLSLINDMLDLSKVEAGKLELNFTSVDLGDIIEECMRLMQEQATTARVVLRKTIPQGLPNVVADLRAMKQILLNLLSNAIKFTNPGGQVITSLKLNEGGELVLKVKDTGVGMDADELGAAMQPFRRVTHEGREEKPGTGLGLPLTKALTEANRAQFQISSERKKGTLVEITFPTTRVLAE